MTDPLDKAAFATPSPVIETEGSGPPETVGEAIARIGAKIDAAEAAGGVTGTFTGDRYIVMPFSQYEDDLTRRYERGKAAALAAERSTDREAVFTVEDIERTWRSGYATGQEYAQEPPFAGLGKHNTQHGWEMFACSLGDRNTLALRPVGAENVRERALENAGREAIALIDEINERAPSRAFNGIGQALHAKLCTIRATLARALITPTAGNGEEGRG